MSDPVAIPAWVSAGAPLLSMAAAGVAYVFGKGSSSGKQSTELKALRVDVDGIQKTLGDTVISVSNHHQSIVQMGSRMNSIDNELKQANTGIATIMERTKRL